MWSQDWVTVNSHDERLARVRHMVQDENRGGHYTSDREVGLWRRRQRSKNQSRSMESRHQPSIRRLRAATKSWGTRTPEQLTHWLRTHGFQQHDLDISTRTQQYILNAEDTGVALLETAFVLVALHQERVSRVPLVTRASHNESIARSIPAALLASC